MAYFQSVNLFFSRVPQINGREKSFPPRALKPLFEVPRESKINNETVYLYCRNLGISRTANFVIKFYIISSFFYLAYYLRVLFWSTMYNLSLMSDGETTKTLVLASIFHRYLNSLFKHSIKCKQIE